MHTVYSRYIGLCLSIIIEKCPINNPRVKRDLEIQDYRLEPENKLILYQYMLNTFSRRPMIVQYNNIKIQKKEEAVGSKAPK